MLESIARSPKSVSATPATGSSPWKRSQAESNSPRICETLPCETPNRLAAALVVSPLARNMAIFRKRRGSSFSQVEKSSLTMAVSAGPACLILDEDFGPSLLLRIVAIEALQQEVLFLLAIVRGNIVEVERAADFAAFVVPDERRTWPGPWETPRRSCPVRRACA